MALAVEMMTGAEWVLVAGVFVLILVVGYVWSRLS